MTSGRILIVEDDTIIAMELSERLKDLNYEITDIVSSGQAAVKTVFSNCPDLVLMDIRLSGDMDGVEAAEKIKKSFDIPIVYLTAYADAETIFRAKKTEPFGYILKPFDSRMLHTNIEMALYRHQMEKKVKQKEQKYQRLFEGVPVAIFRTTPDGKILDANETMVKSFGYPDKDFLLNVNVKELYVDRQDRKSWQQDVHREGVVHGVELQMRRLDGSVVWMKINARKYQDPENGTVYYEGSLEDITEQKAAQEALRQAHDELEKRVEERTSEFLAAIELLNREVKIRKNAVEALKRSEAELHLLSEKLLMILEDERERISRELHDSVGQSLTFIKMSLECCLGSLSRHKFQEVRRSIESLIPKMQDAINEVRHICSGLWPAMLDTVGILKTVQWLCSDFEKCYPSLCIKTKFDIEEQDIPKSLNIVIYRLVQEAFSNIAKHSQAEQINFALEKFSTCIQLKICDDGIGFQAETFSGAGNQNPGIGLSSMKKRAEISGGSLHLSSKPGSGTCVTAVWEL